MYKKQLIRILIILPFLFLGTSVQSAEPELKEIMVGLRGDLVEIIDGLLTGDADLIAKAGVSIAEHPVIPPHQLKAIKKELGKELPKFAKFDKEVHALSLSISEAAKKNDFEQVLQDVLQVQTACMACHTAYKDRVSLALKPAK